MGAWIETYAGSTAAEAKRVAPYVGAWIETLHVSMVTQQSASHPTWVRGLKHNLSRQTRVVAKSHPTWVRGLKLLVHPF